MGDCPLAYSSRPHPPFPSEEVPLPQGCRRASGPSAFTSWFGNLLGLEFLPQNRECFRPSPHSPDIP